MSNNGDILLKMFGVAAAAGAIYGITHIVDEYSKNDDATVFSELLKKQKVCDVLTEGELKKWFSENAKKHPAEVRFLVAKATPENAKMFAIFSLPKDLDEEHTFFQAIVTDDGNVLDLRIVSCAFLSDGLSKLFEGKNRILL